MKSLVNIEEYIRPGKESLFQADAFSLKIVLYGETDFHLNAMFGLILQVQNKQQTQKNDCAVLSYNITDNATLCQDFAYRETCKKEIETFYSLSFLLDNLIKKTVLWSKEEIILPQKFSALATTKGFSYNNLKGNYSLNIG